MTRRGAFDRTWRRGRDGARARRAFERDLRAGLHDVRAPGEDEAATRARARVLAAHAAAPATPRRARLRPVTIAATAAAVAIVVVGALTAPGQAVGDWLRDVVEPQPAKRPAAAPAALPSEGRLLARSSDGVTLAPARGDAERLGPYRDATWSPHGRFLAVTTADALLAVTPAGKVRWRVVPPAPPRRPAWSPDGFRVAYLSGPQLRVLVADGTDDRLFYGHVRDVAPAFKPTASRTIAWIDDDRHARVADVDRAVLEWRSPRPVPRGVHSLSWSSDGRRLLAAGPHEVTTYAPRAARTRTVTARARIAAAAFPPDAGPPAVLEHRRGTLDAEASRPPRAPDRDQRPLSRARLVPRRPLDPDPLGRPLARRPPRRPPRHHPRGPRQAARLGPLADKPEPSRSGKGPGLGDL